MPSAASPPGPSSLSERMKGMLAEYGRLALIIYLVLFVAVLAGFAVAIALGVETASTAGNAGILAAAWLATKLTQPLRILATLAITPLAARGLKALRRERPPEIAEASPGVRPPTDSDG